MSAVGIVQVGCDQWVSLAFAATDPQLRRQALDHLQLRRAELTAELAEVDATLAVLDEYGVMQHSPNAIAGALGVSQSQVMLDKRRTAYEYIEASEVAANVHTCAQSPPTIGQARQLAPLPPDSQRAVVDDRTVRRDLGAANAAPESEPDAYADRAAAANAAPAPEPEPDACEGAAPVADATPATEHGVSEKTVGGAS